MSGRESRDKKAIARFVPAAKKADTDRHAIYEGSGTSLGNIPIVPINLNKIDADHDLLKAFHTFLYGTVGKKTVRKKNIRSFSGFADDETSLEARETRAQKMGESKKWTVAALKDLCALLGLDKGGDKADLIDRVVSFLASPDPSGSKPPVAKKPKGTKKRKSTGKGTRGKKLKRTVKPRAPSGYQMYMRKARPKLKKASAMTPTETMKKLAEMWKNLSDAQKEKYRQKGLKEFKETNDYSEDEGDEEGDGGDEKEVDEGSEEEVGEGSEEEVDEGSEEEVDEGSEEEVGEGSEEEVGEGSEEKGADDDSDGGDDQSLEGGHAEDEGEQNSADELGERGDEDAEDEEECDQEDD